MRKLRADRRRQRPSLIAVCVLAVALTTGCSRNGNVGVVEAPMMSADASASAIALMSSSDDKGAHPPTPTASSTDVPFKAGDRMTGFYTCNQGKTAMTLVFEEVISVDEETAEVEAIFEFHYDGTKPGFTKTDGSARMRGKYEVKARRLRLKGEEWIDQPANYALITLVGTVAKNGAYAGTVDGYGCTSFSAIPDRPARSSP